MKQDRLAQVYVDQNTCTFTCTVEEYNVGWNALELRVLFRHPKRLLVDNFCTAYNQNKRGEEAVHAETPDIPNTLDEAVDKIWSSWAVVTSDWE